ncbi:MAG: glycine zipper 2TM domain-containing protein [Ectothiorhodospiraceae bacterium]|nr:glycine zipper 2TM domain-containing protein [Chromatiales bacterium]MCP5156922.1 glycine zipper 2TM domain-containing protein [Ectothiorhodospiraceae bacterium]
MGRIAIAATLVAAVALAGCQSRGANETMGGLLGAAGGGLLGSQVGSGSGKLAATALGVLAGALIGSEVGRTMDDVDRMKHAQAANSAFESAPTGTSSTWNNPDTGHYGSVTPTRTYQQTDGTYCREFTQTIDVGGRTEQGYGTACRQDDGSWKIVS